MKTPRILEPGKGLAYTLPDVAGLKPLFIVKRILEITVIPESWTWLTMINQVSRLITCSKAAEIQSYCAGSPQPRAGILESRHHQTRTCIHQIRYSLSYNKRSGTYVQRVKTDPSNGGTDARLCTYLSAKQPLHVHFRLSMCSCLQYHVLCLRPIALLTARLIAVSTGKP